MVQIDHRRRRKHFFFMWPNPDLITLTSSANPSANGASVTFTAKVPLGWTGTISFFDGVTQIGTNQTLAGSPPQASVSTSTLTIGSHSITARYNGDATHPVVTSSVLAQTVSHVTSSTALTSSVNPTSSGGSTTLTATVTPATGPVPTGTVTFYDGATAISGAVSLSANVATFSISTLSVGTHPLTAQYSGDATYTPSTSNTVTQTVNAGGTFSDFTHRWPLTDAQVSGSVAFDTGTPGGINFTLNGTITSAAGPPATPYPQARAFSGASGTYLGAAGTIAAFTTTSPFSIAAWIWINDITANGPTSEPYMLMFDNTANGANYALLRNRTGANSGKLLVSASSVSQTTNTAAFANNTWVHVVFTQTSGGAQTIYVNGATVASTGSSGNAAWDGGTNLIGAGTGTDSLLTGRVAGVLVYTRALSAADVSALYAAGG